MKQDKGSVAQRIRYWIIRRLGGYVPEKPIVYEMTHVEPVTMQAKVVKHIGRWDFENRVRRGTVTEYIKRETYEKLFAGIVNQGLIETRMHVQEADKETSVLLATAEMRIRVLPPPDGVMGDITEKEGWEHE